MVYKLVTAYFKNQTAINSDFFFGRGRIAFLSKSVTENETDLGRSKTVRRRQKRKEQVMFQDFYIQQVWLSERREL